jgi:2,5-diketo-D-gluconate reductase A
VDTASIYRNEEIVGRALRDSGKPVFLTTKLNPSEMGYENALLAVSACLARLGVRQVDLVIIHWPGKAKLAPDSLEHRHARIETWRALEKLKDDGKTRFIGVSNFMISHIENLLEDGARTKPYVNQVELHVQLQQRELKEYCNVHGIRLQAYSPLGSGGAPVLEVLTNRSDPLKYALQAALKLSDSVVVKSAHVDRIQQNLEILKSETESFEDLANFEEGKHYCWNPTVVA